MFERFTERARKVIVLAQEEATRLRHSYLGTEHLLVGLLQEESVAAQSLSGLGVTVDAVREQVEGIVGYGEEANFAPAPFTRHSKRMLEFSVAESLQIGHGYVGAEHLLLGLLRESGGTAARVLSNLNVDPDGIRSEVLGKLGVEEDDSRDRVEREMEAATDETFIAAPIGSVRVDVRIKGRTRTLLVDLTSVGESRIADKPSGAVEHGWLLDSIAGVVDGNAYRSLDEAIERSGELMLERSPAVDGIEVSALRERWFERRTRSGIIKTRAFRR